MSEMDDPGFARFLYNQKKKAEILQEDINIQRSGIQEEKRNWRVVKEWHDQRDDRRNSQIVQKELDGLSREDQRLEQRQTDLVQLDGMVNKLTLLPGVKGNYKRIVEAQETIDEKWRLK
jgi:glycosylphosphatidylinositol transamidase (GPIT) subunit GPI8